MAESDSDSVVGPRSATRRQGAAAGEGQAFLTLVGSGREDSVELKGKQFRFKPYGGRGASGDGFVRTADEAGNAGDAAPGEESSDSEIALDGFGLGAQQRNSSAFIASVIAQQLRQGLHNPRHEAASDAYRRAGGSPSAVDNQPRVVSFAV
ncbi:MAG TPA: hypothetical protein VFZ03_18430 [Dongiaceae bacterium]